MRLFRVEFWQKHLIVLPLLILGVLVLMVSGVAWMVIQDPLEEPSYLGEKEERGYITYVVEGDVTNASVSYLDTQEDRIQVDGVSAGWKQQVYLNEGFLRADLTATNGPQVRGSITCKLMQDGKIVIQKTSTGVGASVRCATTWYPLHRTNADDPEILYAPRGSTLSAASTVDSRNLI